MTNWDAYGYVISSRHRIQALQLLQKPFTPSQLAHRLKLSLAHGSKIIRELADKNLIECKNPNAKKGRIYIITNRGQEIFKQISKNP